MKKTILLILLFIYPSFCLADVFVEGVSCGNISIGYVEKILTVGDSITVGVGDSFTYNETLHEDIGGFRTALQLKIGIHRKTFVGQWGAFEGTNDTGSPTLDTRDTDNNSLLKYDLQPRHFGFSGADIQTMVDAFSDLNQLTTWLPDPTSKDLIIIYLGTNNAVDQFTGESPNRVVDDSNVAGDVDYLLTLSATIDTYGSNVPIMICLPTPMKLDPVDSRYNDLKYLDEWIVLFNAELLADIETAQETKSNLYSVDLYTPMQDGWYDGTYSEQADFFHPNHNGYETIADIIESKMNQKGLL